MIIRRISVWFVVIVLTVSSMSRCIVTFRLGKVWSLCLMVILTDSCVMVSICRQYVVGIVNVSYMGVLSCVL